jgi:glycosyltransferase involved in cell wall biosynthesis
VDDLGLDDSVKLLGQLDPEHVRDRLHAADAFLLSSLSEGISNAALEAMACGLPIVTTDCGGMREAIDDGVEGFVVPVREPRAMAEALARLALDPDLRRRMGRAARRRVEREFDLEHQIDRWAELCRRTVSEWRARR